MQALLQDKEIKLDSETIIVSETDKKGKMR